MSREASRGTLTNGLWRGKEGCAKFKIQSNNRTTFLGWKMAGARGIGRFGALELWILSFTSSDLQSLA